MHMKTIGRSGKILLTLALFLALAAGSRAGTFTNGSFELPDLNTNVSLGLPNGDTSLTGWTVGGANAGILLMGNFAPNSIGALDGRQFIVFDSGNNSTGGTIAQSFDTKIGHDYVVSFNVGKLGGGPGLMQITAVAKATGGAVLGVATGSAETIGWVTNQTRFTFTATTTNSTLTFQDTSTTTTNTDLALDNVSVQPQRPAISLNVYNTSEICWFAETNTLYELQYSTSLAPGTWASIGGPVVGSGITNCSYYTSPVGLPRLFFRVVELP
jgi:hypothetical protein